MPYRRTGRPTGRPPHPGPLTPAEQRVLEHVRLGRTNAEIGEALGISADAAKYHVANMLSKLGLPDRRALAAWQPGEPAPRRWWGAALVGWAARGGRWVAAGVLAAVVAALVVAGIALRPAGDGGEIASTLTPPPATSTPGTVQPATTTPTPTGLPVSASATPIGTATEIPSFTRQQFPDLAIDICVVERRGRVDPREVVTLVESMDGTPVGVRLALSGIGSSVTKDCGVDPSGWRLKRAIDWVDAPGCAPRPRFDLILFVVPDATAAGSGASFSDRIGSTACFTGDTGVEVRQSIVAGEGEIRDPVIGLRLLYYHFFGHPVGPATVHGSCIQVGCGPLVPWTPVADAWRYTWPDRTLDVCLRTFEMTVAAPAVTDALRSLEDTATGRAVGFSALDITVAECGVTPIFDPADGPPLRTKNRATRGTRTRDLFVFVYPDHALAGFSEQPNRRIAGQEWEGLGSATHPVSTAVYVTASELSDPERLRLLLGVALGMDPRD